MRIEAEDELLAGLTAIIADLHASGMEDGKAMFLLGGGADRLCASRQSQTWAGFKSTLSSPDVAALLQQIDIEGNDAVKGDKGHQAYALQALALSLAATGAEQQTTKAGESLLDSVIESALTNYRTKARPN